MPAHPLQSRSGFRACWPLCGRPPGWKCLELAAPAQAQPAEKGRRGQGLLCPGWVLSSWSPGEARTVAPTPPKAWEAFPHAASPIPLGPHQVGRGPACGDRKASALWMHLPPDEGEAGPLQGCVPALCPLPPALFPDTPPPPPTRRRCSVLNPKPKSKTQQAGVYLAPKPFSSLLPPPFFFFDFAVWCFLRPEDVILAPGLPAGRGQCCRSL